MPVAGTEDAVADWPPSTLLNRRRFDELPLIVLAIRSPRAVQCMGGRGNESGAGASKYLLPAKCRFGGEFDTPAGEAKHDADAIPPPGLWRLLLLLLFVIEIDGDDDTALGGDVRPTM